MEAVSHSTKKTSIPLPGSRFQESVWPPPEDIDTAYQAAARAQKTWERTSAYNRSAVMEKAAELMVERAAELIEIIIAESGSTRIKADIEAKSAFTMLKTAAQNPFKMETTIHPSFVDGKENRIYRKPIGVIGIISPFNFPFILSLRAVAASLSTGNGVVLKPDPQTYISGGLFLAKLFEDAGLPKGLFNVITSDVEEIGDAFIEHPIPRLISFTGSTQTGRHIAQLCGKYLKRVHLELGGQQSLFGIGRCRCPSSRSGRCLRKIPASRANLYVDQSPPDT